jgi:hypothetical protein
VKRSDLKKILMEEVLSILKEALSPEEAEEKVKRIPGLWKSLVGRYGEKDARRKYPNVAQATEMGDYDLPSYEGETPAPEEDPKAPEPTPLSPEDPLSAALKQAESKYGNSEFVRGLNRKERNVILKFIAVLLEEKLIKVEEGLLDTYQALGIRAKDLKNALKKADEEGTISADERKILLGVLKDDVKGKAFVQMSPKKKLPKKSPLEKPPKKRPPKKRLLEKPPEKSPPEESQQPQITNGVRVSA